MAPPSFAFVFVFVISLWFINSQKINNDKSIDGNCKSETDYLIILEDLRILMLEQQNELTGYRKDMEDLKQEFWNKTEGISALCLQQTNITKEVQEELKNLRKENQEIITRLTVLENLLNLTKGQSNDTDRDFVGFTVALEAINLPQHDSIIKPSKFITNYSSSFSDRGEFVCSKDGIYIFFLHLVTNSRANGAWIYKNDIPMTLTWQEGPTVSTVVSGTASLVADLQYGDRISIKSYKNNLSVNETSVWSGYIFSKKTNQDIAMQSTLKSTKNSLVISEKDMITNVGNVSYSQDTGEFLCTKTGSYKIDINTIINSTSNGAHVYVNDQEVLDRVFSWHSQSSYSSCSTSAVLNLTHGDKLTLKSYAYAYLTGLLNNYSTISIYLLSPVLNIYSSLSCRIKSATEAYITCIDSNTALNSSGYFTCKEDGYYYISINLLSTSTNNGIQIYKNEEALIYAWIGAKWGSWGSVSTTLVVHLTVGDYITFRQMHNNLQIDPSSRIVAYKIHP